MLKPTVQSSIWLRFVKKAALYLIVIILGLQRLQQLVEAAFAVSVEVLAAVDLVESGYSIEQVMRKGDWKSSQASIRYVMVK